MARDTHLHKIQRFKHMDSIDLTGPVHVADIVPTLNLLDVDEVLQRARDFPDRLIIELLENNEFEYALPLIQQIIAEERGDILEALAEDSATHLFLQLNSTELAAANYLLSPKTRASILKLMSYPEFTVGNMMTTEFIEVPNTWTVQQTLDYVRKVHDTKETAYAIYVINNNKQLEFVVSLRHLVVAEPEQLLTDVWQGDEPITVSPTEEREEAAQIIRRYDYLALPVVDEDNHMLGIVTVDDLLDTLMDEAAEDMERFGGAEFINQPYLRIKFGTMLRKRGGWLTLLFVGEMLTASAMQYFEMELEKAVVLAMFIPLIMSSGGNSGSQATSLLIRSLALEEVKLRDWWRVLVREIPTGVVLGALLGALGFFRIILWNNLGIYDYGEHYILIGITIWIALVGIVTFGSATGSMLPFALQRVGLDPASASAPLVATLVDVLGLIIYFSVAAVILTGTLL